MMRPSRIPNSGFGGKIRSAFALAALLLSPVLSGCILGTERPELNLEVPAEYREAQHTRAPDAAVPALDWWRGFRSGELTSLMEACADLQPRYRRGDRPDRSGRRAGGNIGSAVVAVADRNGNGRAHLIRLPGAARRRLSQYNLGLTASYMVDFWGKNRATLYAAEESATVARYNREVVTSRPSSPSPIPISRSWPHRMNCASRAAISPRPSAFWR